MIRKSLFSSFRASAYSYQNFVHPGGKELRKSRPVMERTADMNNHTVNRFLSRSLLLVLVAVIMSFTCILTVSGGEFTSEPVRGTKAYTVSYYALDGSTVLYRSDIIYENGTVLGELPDDKAPERFGYRFIGWADESGVVVTPETEVTGNMKLYATYEKTYSAGTHKLAGLTVPLVVENGGNSYAVLAEENSATRLKSKKITKASDVVTYWTFLEAPGDEMYYIQGNGKYLNIIGDDNVKLSDSPVATEVVPTGGKYFLKNPDANFCLNLKSNAYFKGSSYFNEDSSFSLGYTLVRVRLGGDRQRRAGLSAVSGHHPDRQYDALRGMGKRDDRIL